MVKSKLITQLQVSLPHTQYPIVIGKDLLKDSSFLQQYILSKQVLVVTNQRLAPLYLQSVKDAFTDRQCDVVILEDGERYKNEKSLFSIYEHLMNKQHHRDTTIVALGGGVVGDIAGFAAATYQRGVNLVQIPTTLLAQIDSSVGGKTAINHPLGKNMIGSFYQPNAVIIDINTLNTLPEREFNAGMAEIVKYAILTGGDFLNLLNQVLMNPSESHMADIIAACCSIKARVVQADERENGMRALLNLGHTVGHALETYTDYARWLHGEAVAIGLYCAALLSKKMNGLSDDNIVQIDNLLKLAHLPRRIPNDINIQLLMAIMKKDKKIKNNTLRFILIEQLGRCYINDKVTDSDLEAVLQYAVEGETHA